MINYSENDILYTDTISWEQTEVSSTTWGTEFSATLGASYETEFMVGSASFSMEVSLGYSSEKTSEKSTTYSFEKSIEITTSPGTQSEIELLACVIED